VSSFPRLTSWGTSNESWQDAFRPQMHFVPIKTIEEGDHGNGMESCRAVRIWVQKTQYQNPNLHLIILEVPVTGLGRFTKTGHNEYIEVFTIKAHAVANSALLDEAHTFV
jgi:hypothetical protein